MDQTSTHRRWYSRGYLPHFDEKRVTQSITFRLVDSYPKAVIDRVREELDCFEISKKQRDLARRRKAQEILDQHHGACWLRNPKIATMVQDAFLFFHGKKYDLQAWCVMPNHCHVLITQYPEHTLASILHAWRSFSASKANQMLGRKGAFWARGYYDRYIRNERHFGLALDYIERNPVSAGLCREPEDWPFGSAWFRVGVPC